MKKTLIALFIFLFPVLVQAYTETIYGASNVVFPVLDMGLGARLTALGGAYTAMSEDAASIYINPAGLARVRKIDAGVDYRKWFVDTSVNSVYGCFPIKGATVGASFTYVNMGFFDKTDEAGYQTGEKINPYTMGISGAYAMPLFEKLYGGAGIKLAYQSAAEKNAYIIGADLGLIYGPIGPVMAGFSVENLGIVSAFSAPLGIRGGVNVKIIEDSIQRLFLNTDCNYELKTGAIISAGTEYEIMKIAAIRLGYEVKPGETGLGFMNGYRMGLGFKFGSFRFDYAMLSYGDAGFNHLATIGFSYEEKEERKFSLKEYEQIVASNYYKDAMLFNKLEDYNGALDKMTKAQALMPKHAGIQKWIDLFNQKIAEKQQKARTKIDDATDYYKANRYEEAIATLKELPPGDPDFEKAQGFMKEITDKMDSADAMVSRADTFLKNGEVVSAVLELRKAQNTCPACRTPIDKYKDMAGTIETKSKDYYLKGVASYTEGDIEKAIEYWEKVLILNPNGSNAQKSQDNLKKARQKMKWIKKNK